MNRFQIVEITGEFNHAGTKATADIAVVAERMGFNEQILRMRTTKKGLLPKIQRQMGYIKDWKNCYDFIPNDAIVLLQHPFHHPQLTREKNLLALKRKKKVKFISVVHDVEELREFRYNDYYKREFEVMLDLADIIIVHNSMMKQFFLDKGVGSERLVTLEIFDYLQEKKRSNVTFEKSITIAGNLDITKCRYIIELGKLEEVKVNLYGPNYNKGLDQYKNVKYNGSFLSNEIPEKLTVGFGLVWDGDSIDGCQGQLGKYLKYNNPHKLSLYLSSGMPVVIWDGAAEAKFVKKNGVGVCVESLTELNDVFEGMSESDYNMMIENIYRISRDLKSGAYTERAINKALSMMQ